ncbi:MAG: OsmC family protein [Alphaproteobacteria bacterium]|nr:OsmC family protein [Alphaproteobacteria bacterium]
MKTRIQWAEDRSFTAQTGSGHLIAVGTTKDAEGRTLAPSPMELVLSGAGACSAFDVVHILERGREAITGCVAELEAERAETEPKVFTRVHIHFVVTGRGLAREKVERAIQLSIEKYCSALAMIAKTATITHDFELVEAP